LKAQTMSLATVFRYRNKSTKALNKYQPLH
jgi:hypothetical protein